MNSGKKVARKMEVGKWTHFVEKSFHLQKGYFRLDSYFPYKYDQIHSSCGVLSRKKINIAPPWLRILLYVK